MAQTIDTNYYLDDITILDSNMEYILGVKSIINTELLYNETKEKFIENKRDGNLWLGPFYVLTTTNEPRKYYIQCKTIRRISDYSDIIGYLCISIDESKIKDSYLNIITNSTRSHGPAWDRASRSSASLIVYPHASIENASLRRHRGAPVSQS